MVDYELAVATVQDPNADPVLLAKIAYENPDFGANVAANPRAYAGLKRWIAEFGDERARQYLASLGIVAQAGPVVDQPAPATTAAATPAAVTEPAATPAAAPATTEPAAQPAAATYDYAQPAAQAAVEPAAQPAYAAADYAAQPVPDAAYAAAQPQNVQQTYQPANYADASQSAYAAAYAAEPQPAAAQPVAVQPAAAQPAASGFEVPVATNQYGYTAEQALDPNTDATTLAYIAQYAPELRPCLARNPSTYPELLEWLGQLNDPAVNAALATR